MPAERIAHILAPVDVKEVALAYVLEVVMALVMELAWVVAQVVLIIFNYLL